MKMTKRILAAVLALVMIAVTFTGCSSVELDYLDMVVKNYKNVGTYEAKSEAVITLNRQVIAEMLNSNDEEVAYSADDIPEKIYVTVTAMSDSKEYLQFQEIDVSVPGIVDLGFEYILTPEAAYIGDFYITSEVIDIEGMLAEEAAADEDMFILYNALLGLSDIKYVALPITENGDVTVDFVDATTYERLIEAIKKLYAGFETGAVSKTENGFKISLTAKDMFDLFKNSIAYLCENTDALTEYTVEFIEMYRDVLLSADPDMTNEDIDLVIEELRGEEFAYELETLLEELGAIFDSAESEELVSAFDGSYMDIQIGESNGVTAVDTEAVIAIGGLVFAKVEEASVTKRVEEITLPELDGYTATVEGLIGFYNSYTLLAESQPLESMLITWDGTEGMSQVYGTFTDVEAPIALGLYDFHNIGGSMYLPMRRICERFGEVVDWDPELGRAYVVRGDTKIDMTGVLVDGRTFIKIRDFEKLGYFVDYQVDENGTPWAILCP